MGEGWWGEWEANSWEFKDPESHCWKDLHTYIHKPIILAWRGFLHRTIHYVCVCLRQVVMWRMHVPTWECVLKGMPSRRQSQKATDNLVQLPLPGKLYIWKIQFISCHTGCIFAVVTSALPNHQSLYIPFFFLRTSTSLNKNFKFHSFWNKIKLYSFKK